MSEASTPSNPPNRPEPRDATTPDWENPFPDLTDTSVIQEDVPTLNAVDGDKAAEPRSTVSAKPSQVTASNAVATITALSDTLSNQTEPPDLADLISLIQELNQCNSILLDRVSQLEEALERSHTSLHLEVAPSTRGSSLPEDTPEPTSPLLNQLEFAHQTNQRQQILIDTLTGQLDSSQERVAQLEREAALLQQRYNEQSQLLSQSESACRDLQARLQRQQRYTLQFKAALERCLEVPAPQYEMGVEISTSPAAIPETSFAPRAQRIQPWSSHSAFSSRRFTWMNIGLDESEQSLDLTTPESNAVPESIEPIAPAELPQLASSKLANLKLPSFQLPAVPSDSNAVDGPDGAADLAFSEAEQQALRPVSYNLGNPSLAADPGLMRKLDEAVQPLADLLADAMLGEADSLKVNDSYRSATAPILPQTDQASGVTDAETLLQATMADAEDALWQDLARLIDVSTEDIVKASLSGDFSAFESLDFEALQPDAPEVPSAQAVPVTPPATAPAAQGKSARTRDILPPPGVTSWDSPSPIAVGLSEAALAAASGTTPAAEIPALQQGSSWPSPIVYPLRPTKKRQSLAMVDLPTFRQLESDPLPTS